MMPNLFTFSNSGLRTVTCNLKCLCAFSFSGFVIDDPPNGFPEMMEVTCVEPAGYQSAWVDQIWLDGKWNNLESMANPAGSTEAPGSKPRCIGPNRCYKKPPKLPDDYTVKMHDPQDPQPDNVTTTILYKCERECENNMPIYTYQNSQLHITTNNVFCF